MNLDVRRLEYDPDFLMEVSPNIWLMDNHKWALYIWELYRNNNVKIPSTLIHIDKHWDSYNDFITDEQQEHLRQMSLNDIEKLTIQKEWTNRNELNILYNNFISPAIIRGWIREVHFYCTEEMNKMDLDLKILEKYHVNQFCNYQTIDELVTMISNKPNILDIDIDIFNNHSTQQFVGELWNDDKILEFIDKCEQIINNASIITVAMSFGYSGNKDDTRHLVDLILPKIINYSK